MPGPVPNPDSRRTATGAETFGWTILPAEGRQGPPPPLPYPNAWLAERGGFDPSTKAAWKELWATPQATQFDSSGETLHLWAVLHSAAAYEGPTAARLGELRAILNAHGLGGPKSLQQLRWRIATPGDAPMVVAPRVQKSGLDRRARVLKILAERESTLTPK